MIQVPNQEPYVVFGGCVLLTLIIENESFTVERDWGIEYLIDSKHPDYFSDDWFYENNKCYSDKKSQELIESLNKFSNDE